MIIRAEIGNCLLSMAFMFMSFVFIVVEAKQDREIHELRHRVYRLEMEKDGDHHD